MEQQKTEIFAIVDKDTKNFIHSSTNLYCEEMEEEFSLRKLDFEHLFSSGLYVSEYIEVENNEDVKLISFWSQENANDFIDLFSEEISNLSKNVKVVKISLNMNVEW